MSDPIRDAIARRKTAVYELPEAYRTGPPAAPVNVESLTAGGTPQAPAPRSMDDLLRTGEDWGTVTA